MHTFQPIIDHLTVKLLKWEREFLRLSLTFYMNIKLYKMSFESQGFFFCGAAIENRVNLLLFLDIVKNIVYFHSPGISRFF